MNLTDRDYLTLIAAAATSLAAQCGKDLPDSHHLRKIHRRIGEIIEAAYPLPAADPEDFTMNPHHRFVADYGVHFEHCKRCGMSLGHWMHNR